MYKIKLLTENTPQNTEKIFKVENKLEFEELYFHFLSKKYYQVCGFIDNKIEFVIKNGLEVCNDRAKIVSINPHNWIAPNSDQFKGMVAQFKDKKIFCNVFGVTRAAVANWEKDRSIDFYRWSFLLSYLNIERTFDEGREGILKSQL